VANTQAYYNTATIIAVKSFIVQAPGGNDKYKRCFDMKTNKRFL
jgi:hypothetical protein